MPCLPTAPAVYLDAIIARAASLNVEAPFCCDLMNPSSFMFVRKAPDLEAIRAARKEERKRAKRSVEESKEVTYKVTKPGSGPWQVCPLLDSPAVGTP